MILLDGGLGEDLAADACATYEEDVEAFGGHCYRFRWWDYRMDVMIASVSIGEDWGFIMMPLVVTQSS